MDPVSNIILILVIVFFIILCAAAVPFLIQLWHTFNNLNVTLQTLNQHLPGIMKNMEDITANVDRITGNVDKQVEGFVIPVMKLQAMFTNLTLGLESTLKTNLGMFPLFKAARSLPAVLKGVRAFVNTLRSPH
jgi:predicted PurR-regulated permease PerM